MEVDVSYNSYNLEEGERVGKRVIQVPMDEALLEALDSVSQRRASSRAEVIREACRRYLKALQDEELDRQYQEGYRRVPEEPALAQAQTSLAGQVLSEEIW